MIQRIQSVFLFLFSASTLGLLGAPFAYSAEATAAGLFADRVYNLDDHVALLVLFLLSAVLTFVSIFLYKNRSLQMKVVGLSLLLLLGAIIFAAVLFFQAQIQLAITAGFGIALPILGIIFGILAYNYIKKDEKLVRSIDRLR